MYPRATEENKIRKLILLILLSVITSSLLGCATMDELRRGMNAIDSFWGETNESYLSKYGKRAYPIDIDTSVSAMNAVMTDFDINLEREYRISEKELHMTFKGIASSVLSEDEFKEMKKVEEPMMQAIAANEVGDFTSNFFVLQHGDDFEIVVRIDFEEVTSMTYIVFDFSMYPKKEDTYKLYGDNPPPEAVKIALNKTWDAFEDQVKTITGKQIIQISSKAAAEKKKIEEEEEKLERERSDSDNSLKRVVAIFEKLKKNAPEDTITNSMKAYRQAKDEGYKPEQLPEIHSQVVIVTEEGGAYRVRPDLDTKLPLEERPLELTEAKKYIEKHMSENIIAIQLAPGTFKRIVTDQSKVQSRYIYNYLIEANPEYYVAKLDYQRALSNYNREVASNAANSATYSNGWAAALAGGLKGFSEGTARQAVEKARNRLAQISPTRKVPQEKTYEYDKMTVMVKKYVPYSVYLIKEKKVQEWKGDFTNDQTFTIAYNKKDDDTGSNYNAYDLESDVEKYERADVTIRGQDVTDLLFTKPKSLRSDQSMAYLNPPTKKKQKVAIKKKATKNKVAGLMNSVVAIQDNGKETIGTGFFIKKNIILTNRHVIDGKKLITIHTREGIELLGKVINVHHDLDLALIEVDGSGIPVWFYDSEVAPGDEVFAIGNPMGLEFSLTKGVVSNVRLRKDESRPFPQQHLYIQTDVAINPGNSGGPLFLNGKVVGINTSKLVAKDIEGIGFAIHYNEIMKYLEDTAYPVTSNAEVVSNEKKPKKKSNAKPGEIIKKMEDLKYLYDHQLITTKEYQKKKTNLLEAM